MLQEKRPMENNYQNKIKFINKLNESLEFGEIGNIKELKYEIYQDNLNKDRYSEFLVVTHKAGNFEVKHCSSYSTTLILEKVMEMLRDDHRFHHEFDYYFAVRKKSTLIQ